jgi:hypothetical protein
MVRFTRHYGKYNKDETATFSPDHEKWLIKQKYVVEVEAPVAKSTSTDPKGGPQPPANQPGTKDPGQPQTRQTTVGPQRSGR